MPDSDLFPIETSRRDEAAVRLSVLDHPRLLESFAVAGKSAGHDHRAWKDGIETAHEFAAVDLDSVGKDKDASQRRTFELVRQGLAGREGLLRRSDRRNRGSDGVDR